MEPAAGHTPGAECYRTRLLKDVLAHVGDDVAARQIAVVDLHAYHSKSWVALPITLSTQHYTFDLVARRVDEGAFVVVLRAGLQ